MDLTLPVTYRGITLTGAAGGPGGNDPIDGIRLTRAQYSQVSTHGYVEKKSLSDGMDASDVYMGQRAIVLNGEVFADTKAKLFDHLNSLRLSFTPTDAYLEDPNRRGYLPLAFQEQTLYLAHWPTGLVDKVLYCRPSAQPEYVLTFAQMGDSDGRGFVVPFTAGLEAKDPRFYHPESIDIYISGGAGSGDFTNRGNYPAPLNFILHVLGSNTGSGVFTFSGVGSNFNVTVPAGNVDRTVRVDSVNKVVTMTSGSVETLRMDLIEFVAGTTWPQVQATPEGDSPAGYTWSSSIGLDTLSRMFFNETWA